ncbi:MAG: hypothetical protein HRT71_17660 [Flavobacteriales bacterium]|nr:hypothetical protein [Flavobacteriales bacterium]
MVFGLEKLGFKREGFHYLGIDGLVSKLMQVPEGKEEDLFGEEYSMLMKEVVHYDVSKNHEELRPLAEAAYVLLKDITLKS